MPIHSPHQSVRARLEANERSTLSPLAACSADAQREHEEEESGARTRFQRDRDRILHTKAFRRLKHKTQVFIAPEGDHYRTRLTHTLEVTQIARTVARALRLNEDLVESIGLGHDLGHTPFGHAGEAALSRAIGSAFRHNDQSLRVVEVLERNGVGLNLTAAVRNGIAYHSKVRSNIEATAWGTASTLEGQIIKVADSVAYINHDIDDAVRAGVLHLEDLPREVVEVLGSGHGERINSMVCDLIDNNWWATGEMDAPPGATIGMSEGVRDATNALREFMFSQVYLASPINDEDNRVGFIIEHLFGHFMAHPEQVPADLRAISAARGDEPVRAVVDYIAGMTDRYALKVFNAIYVPRIWSSVDVQLPAGETR
jgi:dGTPase